MIHLLWIIPVVFSAGFGLGCWWVVRPDSECALCRAEQRRIVTGLENMIHGLKSTNGKLGQQVQTLSMAKDLVKS